MLEKLNGKIEMSKEYYYEMVNKFRDLQKENSRLEKEIEELEEIYKGVNYNDERQTNIPKGKSY